MKIRNLLIIFFTSCLLGFIIFQIIFVGLNENTSANINSVVKVLLNSEIERSDFDRLTIFVRNLEENALIACAKLTLLSGGEGMVIYESPIKSSCNPNTFFLEGYRQRILMRSLDGRDWSFKYTNLPAKTNHIFLWLLRFLLIIALFSGLYSVYIKARENDRVSNAIDLNLRGIVHDLRSPLGGLKILLLNADLLNTDKGLALLKKSIARLDLIIESILSGKSNSLPGGIGEFKIINCVTEAALDFEEQKKVAGVQVSIKIHNFLSVYVT